MDSSDDRGELLRLRYQQLIEELGAEYGKAHGWKRQVADRLGISPAHLTRIRKGTRNVSLEAAVTAAVRVGFDPAYFSAGRADEELSYSDFVPDREPLETMNWITPASLREEARHVLALSFADDFDPNEARSLAAAIRGLSFVREAASYEQNIGPRGAGQFQASVSAGAMASGVLHWIARADSDENGDNS